MALRGNGLADDVPVDRWQICRFTPPSHVMIEVGVAHAVQHTLFSEDLEMLERQQLNLLTWPERPLLKLNNDAGGLQARKVIDRWLASERGAPVAE